MRHVLIVGAALLALGEAASAQTLPSYQGYESGGYGIKEIVLPPQSENAKQARKKYGSEYPTYEEQQREYAEGDAKDRDEREQWLERYRIYDNVVSLRKKDAVMAWVDAARKKLGVSELEGYQRLGKYNPYTGESYIRYYDKSTGELVIAELRLERAALDKAKEEIEARAASRLKAYEAISASYQKVLDSYRAARDERDAEDARLQQLAAASTARRESGTPEPTARVVFDENAPRNLPTARVPRQRLLNRTPQDRLLDTVRSPSRPQLFNDNGGQPRSGLLSRLFPGDGSGLQLIGAGLSIASSIIGATGGYGGGGYGGGGYNIRPVRPISSDPYDALRLR